MNFTAVTFDNRFVDNLPADNETHNAPRQVQNAAYSLVTPTKVSAPALVAWTDDVAAMLGFDPKEVQSTEFTAVCSGNKLLPGMQPYAMCYGGHQFGHWAGQLGDGRAINLGEVVTPTMGHQTLQLKGAGVTPYSRTADGLAVLRSSVREFLCSEAMFHLGIASTRALSLCLTGEQVNRDMFYDGNVKAEYGAVVCRVSASFCRFGSFQLPSARGDIALLKLMVDQCIKADFPELLAKDQAPDKQVYLAWLGEISMRTCDLIVNWMRVGFVHGVMNTDNMSIIGETIDYGPYGWIDDFDLNWTPNTTDKEGKRYRFGAQGEIGQWNIFQLANAIYPLVDDAPALQQILADYAKRYQSQWQKMMAAKLGLITHLPDDLDLIFTLEQLLGNVETDMTLFYRQLAKIPLDKSQLEQGQWLAYFDACYYQSERLDKPHKDSFELWLMQYIDRVTIEVQPEQRRARMDKVNPLYVLRNYIAQQAIDAAEKGDFSLIHQLQKVLKNPYDEQDEYQRYAQKRPEWARYKAGCSMLSCSS